MTALRIAQRIPPACRVMPTFFFFFFFSFSLRVSVPFYQVVRICRQTAAKLRMQGYHTCTLFYISKLWYTRACKRIYAATKMRKFRHICMSHWKSRIRVPSWSVTSAVREVRANFNRGQRRSQYVDKQYVTIFMKYVRYDDLFCSLTSWVTILFYIKIVVTKNIPNL